MDSNSFLDYILYLLQKSLKPEQNPENVINHVSEQHLMSEMLLKLGDSTNLDELMGFCQQVIYYSVNTQSKFFVNDLYGGGDLYGILADFLTTYLNTSNQEYENAPLFTVMEREIINKSLKLFGYNEGGSGQITTHATLLALQLAKTYINPKLNGAGLYITTPMKVFCSDQASSDLKQAMILGGFGSFHLITIPSDQQGRMDVSKLEPAIKNHSPHPLMVVATAGTNLLGSFDNLQEISKITTKYKIWLHLDASWGGSVIFSEKYRTKLLPNLTNVNSIIWKPHYMLKVPMDCTIFLTKHVIPSNFRFENRVNSLKFWLPWKIYGDQGYQLHLERNLMNAETFTKMIRDHPKFKLVNEPEFANVCFWYLPQEKLTYGQLHELAPKIKDRLLSKGKIMINYGIWGDLPNFFRMVFHDSRLNESDLKNILDLIEETGQEIYLEIHTRQVNSAPVPPKRIWNLKKLEKRN